MNCISCVWINKNGINNQSEYAYVESANLLPPTNLSIAQSSNDYGVFIEMVSPGVQQYLDHNQHEGEATTYGVAAVDKTGFQSQTAPSLYSINKIEIKKASTA